VKAKHHPKSKQYNDRRHCQLCIFHTCCYYKRATLLLQHSMISAIPRNECRLSVAPTGTCLTQKLKFRILQPRKYRYRQKPKGRCMQWGVSDKKLAFKAQHQMQGGKLQKATNKTDPGCLHSPHDGGTRQKHHVTILFIVLNFR